MYRKSNEILNKILMTGIASFILLAFIAPLGYMVMTGLKSDQQMSDPQAPKFWPNSPKVFGMRGKSCRSSRSPGDGTRELAIQKTRQESWFVDPQNPDAGQIQWEGNWRKLDPVYEADPHLENFQTAWEELDFPRLFRNSLIIAGLGTSVR